MKYPSNLDNIGNVKDPKYLYTSLGSFWVDIFREQNTLRGYTKALAEEIIQRYYDLVEAVNSYSIEDINVFHKVRWQPIIIRKSKFGFANFTFEKGKAVFGIQSHIATIKFI